MNLNSQLVDKFSIAISSLCVAHCLVFPILVVLIPSFATLGLGSETMHFWMIVTVIPSSIYALALGCKKHAKVSVFLIGALGLSSLLLAFVLGGNILGETGEKALTVLGAAIIALAHVRNYKLCQKADDCKCHN